MKKHTRTIAVALVTLFSAQLLSSCFGKFALVRMLYKFNDGLAGDNIGGRFIKTLVFYVLNIIPVYGIAGLVDFWILNLIEFWTGKNILAMNEGEVESQLVAYNGKQYLLTGIKGKLTVKDIESGKETALYFNTDNTVTVLNNGQMVKVADYSVAPATFASVETGIVVANN